MESTKEMEKREKIASYFDEPGGLGCVATLSLIIALILIYLGFKKNLILGGFELYYYGFGLLALSILIFIYSFKFGKKSTSDEEMDKLINEDLQQIESKAIKLLDFEEESLLTEPVTLISTPNILESRSNGCEQKMKIGDDEYIRYTPIDVTILYPTANMVACYSTTWDMLTGKAINENTDEYFYQDITSVSMKQESVQMSESDVNKINEENEISKKVKEELLKRIKKLPNKFDKLVLSGVQQIAISTSGGNNVKIFLKNSEIEEMAGFRSKDVAEMEKGIQKLRKLIRDKKSGS